MEKDTLLPIKEWNKLSGLKLHNYDGFNNIYSGLFEDHNYDINIEDILTTRLGFERGLLECTIDVPTPQDLVRVADLLPEYAENTLLNSFYTNEVQFNNRLKSTPYEDIINDIKERVRCYKLVREKCIKYYDNTKTPIDSSNVNYIVVPASCKSIIDSLSKKLYIEDIEDDLIIQLESDLNTNDINITEVLNIFNALQLLNKITYRCIEHLIDSNTTSNIYKVGNYIEVEGSDKLYPYPTPDTNINVVDENPFGAK